MKTLFPKSLVKSFSLLQQLILKVNMYFTTENQYYDLPIASNGIEFRIRDPH